MNPTLDKSFDLDWLARMAAEAAIDAHGAAYIPAPSVAYSFLQDNPECVGLDDNTLLPPLTQDEAKRFAAAYVRNAVSLVSAVNRPKQLSRGLLVCVAISVAIWIAIGYFAAKGFFEQ